MMSAQQLSGVALVELLPELAGSMFAGLRLDDLTDDSREVVLGGLFCACSGVASHGLDYLRLALDQGAAVVLAEPDQRWNLSRIARQHLRREVPVIPVDRLGQRLGEIAARFHARMAAGGETSLVSRMRITGITGTNGKTSCAWLLAQLDPHRCAVIGTLGSGFIDQLQGASHTTPGAVALQRRLAELAAIGAESIAMEVSSHALDQHRVGGVAFADAIFTNLSRDHLDYHPDMASYADAKARLFAWPGLERAVINADDPQYERMLRSLARDAELVLYGLARPGPRARPARRIWVEDLQPVATGIQLRIAGDWGSHALHLPLLGPFNARNLLAVLGLLLARGESIQPLLQRVASLIGVPGRMQRIPSQGPAIVVDFAHTPDALEQALRALRIHASGRLICVFGCGGDRDQGKRPLMGGLAERLADHVILTSDNPRSEDPLAILEQIRTAAPNARVEPDRRTAIRQAVAEARPDDLILVAGKGHEKTQQIGDLYLPFDDVEEARQALTAAGYQA